MSLPPHLASLLTEARRTAAGGDLQQAARLYNQLVSAQPAAAEAWLELTRLLIQARQTAIAIECCRIWRLKSPGAGAPLAQGYYALACHLHDGGKFEDGIAGFATAAEIDPTLHAAWRSLAAALLRQARAVEALAPARRAAALAPDDRESRFLLAFALADSGDKTGALAIARSLADAEPGNPRYHYFLEELLLAADHGAETLRRNDRFETLVLAELETAAAGAELDALLVLERHLMDGGNGARAWPAYRQVAAHPAFSPAQRSRSFDATRHQAAGELVAPVARETLADTRKALGRPAIAAAKARLVMLLLVRDEMAVVRDTIRFHLNHGVDFIIVTDNGSIDGTRELLADLERELPILVLDEPGRDYRQDLWTTRMAYLACDMLGAEWVFSGDADEFWVAEGGDLAAAIARDAAHYGAGCNLLSAPVILMVPDRDEVESPDFRLTRTRRAFLDPLGRSQSVSRKPEAFPLHRQLGKMLFRADDFVALWPGNHYAVADRPHWGLARDIVIHHFHVRSFEHLRRKTEMVHAAMAQNPQWQAIAPLLAEKLALDRAGGLRAEYDRTVWPTELYRAASAAGRLVETDRILQTLDRAPPARSAAHGDPAALGEWAARYIDAVSPLVPTFRAVNIATN